MRRRWGVSERGHHREELAGHRRERERGRASRERETNMDVQVSDEGSVHVSRLLYRHA